MKADQQKLAEETVAYMRQQGLTIDQDAVLSDGIWCSDDFDLGFSLNSLKHIDRLLEALRRTKGGASPKDLLYIGYYVGEVLDRHGIGHWITDTEGTMKNCMIVEIPGLFSVNPIIECWNRLRDGENESIERNVRAILNVKNRLRKEAAKAADDFDEDSDDDYADGEESVESV